ncbi:IS110 family transposase [Novosphingobium sp. PC22D]|uniref:IS110 family transposase n=1 Tax=Novosphingobium sp. PC22D TaxID=1962403 RepID=UPI000BF03CD2|nr:IS110 family transposase [Novosphingobium sp. PC22D]PEQ10192.1 IS110 family transposase [Novosphingobium sp. PC22D]
MTNTPIAVLGIDLGKNSCSLAGMDASGAVVMRKRMTRDAIVTFATTLPPCVIAMEACCGAHFLGRTLALHGHTIRLMSPEYVQPYVKAQKTDDRDAEAIAEAATRPTMRFVSLKSENQLDLQILHRVRERLVNARTALINQLRAVLLERGIILPKGRINLMRRLEDLMTGDPAVSARTATLLADLRGEWAGLDQRIRAYDDELAALTREDAQARRLATIPGIGVINATALLAAIGDGSAFAKGRDLAAWLGLTPRQHSTGGKTKLLGISKRGNGYLRKQLIHGARAAMPHLAAKPNQLGAWLQAMLTRAHPNVVVVALAAKLARIAWAVLQHEKDFNREAVAAV